MKLLLHNTAHGLIPVYDADYDEKRRLVIGRDYEATIREARNIGLHRKYFALLSCAWEVLPERLSLFFGSQDGFRKTVQVAAGYYEPVYNMRRQEWQQVPTSIDCGSMDGLEFSQLYDRVKDVVFGIIGKYMTEAEFEKNLINF